MCVGVGTCRGGRGDGGRVFFFPPAEHAPFPPTTQTQAGRKRAAPRPPSSDENAVPRRRLAGDRDAAGCVDGRGDRDADERPPSAAATDDRQVGDSDGDAPPPSALDDEADVVGDAGLGDVDADADASADDDTDARPPGVGAPGHVKRIDVTNFMCHARFGVDLGPRVNFVSGVNGSGKSALLQALQLALGERAAATGRATAAAALVRSGAREAVIKVILWNGAPDGHRREELGDEVTIERRISVTGASTWALRSADSRLVSTARADVDALLEALSIDASNPVAVMTQDVARSFLGGGGGGGGGAGAVPSAAAAASKKFEVYVRATLLSRIEAGLQTARDTVTEAAGLVQAEARRVGERRAALKELQASVERARARPKCTAPWWTTPTPPCRGLGWRPWLPGPRW